VRVEVPAIGAPIVSALAFRADVAGLAPSEVLAAVDPLSSVAAPNGRCALHDVDTAARVLRSKGGGIELEEMPGVDVEAGEAALRLTPRLYPDMATAVVGVVGEAGPASVGGVPATVRVLFTDLPPPATAELTVPPVPRIVTLGGALPAPHSAVSAAADLEVAVAFGDGASVEVRPYGATLGLSCPVGDGGRVVIPRALLSRVAAGRRFWASFDAVRRETAALALAGEPGTVHISVEVRSSTVMELRP